ncbi:MAG: hypothetical protein AB3N20_22485 [Rhizobiaceae bacterium]
MKTLTAIVLFGSILAALAMANLYMAAKPVDASGISPKTRPVDQLAGAGVGEAGNGTDHIEALTFVQTFSRPLFSQDRRKYQPPKAKPKPKPKKVAKKQPVKKPARPPDFRLMGVSIVGTAARALIVGGSTDGPQWIAEGDAISEWTLTKVHDQSILVTQGEMEVMIELYPQSQ